MSILSSLVDPLLEDLLGPVETWLTGALKLQPKTSSQVDTLLGLPTGGGQQILDGLGQAGLGLLVGGILNATGTTTANTAPASAAVGGASTKAAAPIASGGTVQPGDAAPVETTNPVASTTEVTHTVVTDGAGNTVDSVTGLPVSESDGLAPNPNASTEQG